MVLQVVRLYLGMQAYAATLLPQIDDAPPSNIVDLSHRCIQLGTTVTPEAAEGISGQTFRMHPD
jgi:hypothetical protein